MLIYTFLVLPLALACFDVLCVLSMDEFTDFQPDLY